jgi:hypothetical protein
MADLIEKFSQTGFYKFFEKFFDLFFDPEKADFDNLNRSGGIVTLRTIIIGIMFGFCFGAIAILYEKRVNGSFVKRLLLSDCVGSDKAKTLDELEFKRSFAIRSSLRGGSSLKRWVRCVEEDEFFESVEKKRAEFEAEHPGELYIAPKFTRDCDTMRFYIPAELKYKADMKFSTKGANVVSAVLVILVSIILCAALCSVIPDMLTFADNFITIIRS